MIPRVFVSSTVADLHYLRDAIRDVLAELGMQPVMSEYGDIGFLAVETAEASCYTTLQQCQIAVFVIGKRYGSRGRNNLSITHNEYRTAVERGIPYFCLVDEEVLAFRKVADANPEKPSIAMPGLDGSTEIFGFVSEVARAPRNNAIIPFTSVATARHHLRQQLTHLFGDLLEKHADPVKADVRDILSEVKALRHELVKKEPDEASRLVRGIRLLLEEEYEVYRHVLEAAGKFEEAVIAVMNSPTFEDAMRAVSGENLKVVEFPSDPDEMASFMNEMGAVVARYWRASDMEAKAGYGVTQTGAVLVDANGRKELESLHAAFLKDLASPRSARAAPRSQAKAVRTRL